MSAPLLSLQGLTLSLPTADGEREIVHGLDLHLAAGEALGLVGESGSGKSLTARSIIRLLPRGSRIGGDVRFDDVSIPAMDDAQLRRFRANDAAMIFQDPRAHINPIRTLGAFLTDGLVQNQGVSKADATRRAADLLNEVGIGDAHRRMNQRSHELSGGLLQRVMIAAALLAQPQLLLADEPTTALDVTTQEEVMAILDEQRRHRGLAMIFITHDLDLAAAVCDRLAVMREGEIVETLPAATLHSAAQDPYTRELLAARVGFDDETEAPL